MSVENEKVCCNCRHCKRIQNEDADIECHCEADNNKYLSYFEVMEGWCRHWAKERGDTEESDAEFMCKVMSKTINKSTDDRNFIGGF